MAKMTEHELKAIVEAESRQALGYTQDELAADREDGWDSYLQEPYGNEIEGRSSVVSSDVQDTVEWILPNLMRIFTAGENAVEFAPQGPEDEEAAKQATDYANYVWDRDNPGFLNTYTWFKDALISKNAFIKIYYESQDDWKREEYEGLDDNAFALLVADEEKEIIEHSEQTLEVMGPDGVPAAMTYHDAVVKWSEESGKICIEPVPADEILFSRDAKDVQNCRYFAHRSRRTISDLIEQYPSKRKQIEDIAPEDEGLNAEQLARSTVNEEDDRGIGMINAAMREVWVLEHYIRVDYNGDGIAEMRKITTAGGSSVVLDNEEWEGPRPFAGLTPIPIPHRIVGLSIADLVKDLQKIKTAILRQYLDALYIGNNPRYEVDETNVVDPAEVITSKPGGIIRKRNANPLMVPVPTVDISSQALAGLNYVDQLRENRTGVSSRTQGLGADSLHDTASGEQLLYTAAQSRIELIARVFAETGVKEAFKLILWLANNYQQKERVIRLRNQWVPMNPGEWSQNFDMSVNVGLGNGDKTKQLVALDRIAAMQIKAVEMQGGANGPLVTLENLHNTAAKYVEAAELKTPELYFSDPKMSPPPQPQENPLLQVERMKIEAKQQEMAVQSQLESQKAEAQLRQEQVRSQNDVAIEQSKIQAQMELERWKAELEARTALEKAQIDAQTKIAVEQAKAENDAMIQLQLQRNEIGAMLERAKGVSGNDQMVALMAGLQSVANSVNSPKRVVRGPDGKVVGVEPA